MLDSEIESTGRTVFVNSTSPVFERHLLLTLGKNLASFMESLGPDFLWDPCLLGDREPKHWSDINGGTADDTTTVGLIRCPLQGPELAL